MPREKFKTLTEQMLYVLLVLQEECYGVDIMERVGTMTGHRVAIGAGTLYTLLDSFVDGGYIKETRTDGRKRCYRITPNGRAALLREQQRLHTLVTHLDAFLKEETNETDQTEL